MTARFLVVALIVAAAVVTARIAAADSQFGIVIDAPWARASILQSRPGAAYLTIRNTGAARDRLLAVSSPLAEHAAVHAMERTGDTLRMHALPDLAIAPGATVVLEPGGMHLMLVGLRRKLVEGEELPLVLKFERAGHIEVKAAILPFAAKGP